MSKIKLFFTKLFQLKEPGNLPGHASLYRITSIFAPISAMIQCIIWCVLCMISLLYFGIGAPHDGKNTHLMSGYAYIFSSVYYNSSANQTGSCSNISPQALFALTMVYLILCLHLILTSVLLIVAANNWDDAIYIRRRVTHWIISIFLMSLWEFVCGAAFFIDFAVCSDRGQHNVAAAAVTLSTLFFKGYLLFIFNLSICLFLFCIQYCGVSECPV